MSVKCRPFFLPRELIIVIVTAVYISTDANASTALSPLLCPTRGENTLDHVYSNIKNGYRTAPLPHLGESEHLSLLLIPAYSPLRRRSRLTTRTITTWPDTALSELQDSIQRTDWDLFEHQDLDAYTGTVLDYIKFYINTVSFDRTIQVFPNQKLWMSSQVRSLLKARDTAFRSGDRALYSCSGSS